MSKRLNDVRPSDLATKRVTAPDGTIVRLKVVKADSPTLSRDILAAFRSNVRSIRDERRKRQNAANTTQA